MALAKLWNAVFGKRTPTEVPAPAVAEPKSIAAAKSSKQTISNASIAKPAISSSKTAPPVIKLSRKKAKVDKQKPEMSLRASVEATAPPTVRMFKRKNNAWSKLIGNRNFTTVLDLNIGDGSRAVEILEAIVDATNSAPRLIAISLFEMSGSGISVRQFHQKIRAAGGLPNAIPMALPEGLRRLSETVGTVDLVVFDGDDQALSNPLVNKLLTRVIGRDALVLKRDSAGRWQSNTAISLTRSRQAA